MDVDTIVNNMQTITLNHQDTQIDELADLMQNWSTVQTDQYAQFYHTWKTLIQNKDNPSPELIRSVLESFDVYLRNIDFSIGPREVNMARINIEHFITTRDISFALAAYDLIHYVISTPNIFD